MATAETFLNFSQNAGMCAIASPISSALANKPFSFFADKPPGARGVVTQKLYCSHFRSLGLEAQYEAPLEGRTARGVLVQLDKPHNTEEKREKKKKKGANLFYLPYQFILLLAFVFRPSPFALSVFRCAPCPDPTRPDRFPVPTRRNQLNEWVRVLSI